MAELTKMRATLARYQSASGAENPNVTLKKTTYDSLIVLLINQQEQLTRSQKEIELIRKKLMNLNVGLGELSAKDHLSVYFESGSRILTKAFEQKIKELVLVNGQDATYTADGFADAEGPKELNDPLSKSRALEVKKYMVETLKLKAEQIVTHGFGSEHRICESTDDVCNRQNRRVEIKAVAQQKP
ncbi:MAG TPA: OmpA family protein [Bacteroidia bacterium]|jgi:outer membrane protein OmpA-like peptidoglycan-associated protein|nr:OmpA family protein [Bacteroidia bacterium]